MPESKIEDTTIADALFSSSHNDWTDGEPMTVTDGLLAIASAIRDLARATKELATAPIMGTDMNDIGAISESIREMTALAEDMFFPDQAE